MHRPARGKPQASSETAACDRCSSKPRRNHVPFTQTKSSSRQRHMSIDTPVGSRGAVEVKCYVGCQSARSAGGVRQNHGRGRRIICGLQGLGRPAYDVNGFPRHCPRLGKGAEGAAAGLTPSTPPVALRAVCAVGLSCAVGDNESARLGARATRALPTSAGWRESGLSRCSRGRSASGTTSADPADRTVPTTSQ